MPNSACALYRSHSNIIGLGFLIVLLGLLGGAAVVQGNTQTTDGPTLVQRRDFGSWSYILKREPNNTLSAEVHFDTSSAKGVVAFQGANKVLAKQLASSSGTGKAEIFVMFKEPVDVATYRAWTRKANISYFETTEVMALDGRSTDSSHPLPPVQVSIFPNSSDPLPQANFEQAIKSTESGSGGSVTIGGVDAFQARVDPKQLPTIADDPQVLLADVTANVIRNDVRAAGIKSADEVDVYNPIPVFSILELYGAPNPR